MTPTSYQAPSRGDAEQDIAVSQSVQSNLSTSDTTVAQVLKQKGDTIFSVKAGDTIADAVLILKERRIGALLVLDQNGDLEGILSERDIVRKLAVTPGETLPQKVGDLMTRNVVTCSPDDLLISVLTNMTEGRFRHMPVMSDGKIRGIVTIGDVVHYRLHELEYEALRMKQLIVG